MDEIQSFESRVRIVPGNDSGPASAEMEAEVLRKVRATKQPLKIKNEIVLKMVCWPLSRAPTSVPRMPQSNFDPETFPRACPYPPSLGLLPPHIPQTAVSGTKRGRSRARNCCTTLGGRCVIQPRGVSKCKCTSKKTRKGTRQLEVSRIGTSTLPMVSVICCFAFDSHPVIAQLQSAVSSRRIMFRHEPDCGTTPRLRCRFFSGLRDSTNKVHNAAKISSART